MGIESSVLKMAIDSLNVLAGGVVNDVNLTVLNEDNANELKGYLNNYNVKIEKTGNRFYGNKYKLTISKKEKVA
jgi:hydrogenase maturation factor HypE